ncbi:N-acylphosphatidylethanolamine synthase-like [Mangifera indica]|uniref:N-acylphosphatidylethanolamine synthase-like n=1 Tax=Mangifera indica TaxID=29780 RepID=UPI001CFC0A5B|nr:N-acylphosphatidylethanolamine synthase-like [Mangifera indica]
MRKKMEWSAQANHMGGLPRKLVFMAVGAFAKTVAKFLITTYVHNADTLICLVHSRPCGVPLLTVSNHMSTLDDPVMWGFKGFPTMDAKLARWVLAVEDICFKNPPFPYVFRLGKSRFLIIVSEVCSEFEHDECFSLHIFVTENCNATVKCIPITKGGGIYQEHMNEAIKRLSDGEWVCIYDCTICTPMIDWAQFLKGFF